MPAPMSDGNAEDSLTLLFYLAQPGHNTPTSEKDRVYNIFFLAIGQLISTIIQKMTEGSIEAKQPTTRHERVR